jgi:DNA modification methylase
VGKIKPRALRVEQVSPGMLKLDVRNPRLHSARQINQIARSITSFGFVVPALIDREGKVLAGHGRIHAARKLGLTEIPVIRLEHLTPEQARAFSIADNRLADIATWDDRVLGEILGELSLADLDFEIEATGFTAAEIDLRIEGLSMLAGEGPDPDDQLPIPDLPPVTRPGGLWWLGPHRVFCGNALEPASFATIMAGKKARLVFTDPPYNVPITGHVSGLGRIRHREFAMGAGELSRGAFVGFLTRSFALLAENSVSGSLHYVCIDWRHVGDMISAGETAFAELKNIAVWVKDNAGMGSFYRSQHELVCVFKSGTGRHRNNIELGRHGRNRSNVWRYPAINDFGRHGEDGNLLALHPTMKPVRLVADAILDASARSDIVLDPFLGSGSTLLAAERVGRICYGIELDPLYVDTAVRRWQRLTGAAAIYAATGIPFDELEREAMDG